MNYLTERLKKVCESLEDCDALYITDDVTRRYIFNFASTAGIGFISREKCVLLLDFRYYEKAVRQQKQGEMAKEIEIIEQTTPVADFLKTQLSACRIRRLFFEDRHMTHADFCSLRKCLGDVCELAPMGDRIERFRMVKDEYELARIIQAQRITDAAFSHILNILHRGMTEREVALELEFFMRKNGADGLAFDTICVSGKKSSMPHGVPEDIPIEDGFLTMDFGARFDGYCSDMTRTVCVGEPSDEMRHVYDTVFEAQKAALNTARGGLLGMTVDKAARDVIDGAGYKGCFGHATGHSLGLEIHESPNFSPKEERVVPCGAVISVEPGIYIPEKCGVRIEDIVFLTENGCKNLTNSTKEFIIIK